MNFRSFLLGLVLAALSVAGQAEAQQPPASGPKEVGVVAVKAESVPLVSTLPGRAVARDAVDIRPRVDGFVTEVLYNPGQPIKAGDPMFRIDPTTYEAAVEEARANLASAKAAVPQAEAAYERARRLQGSGSTQAALEQAQATMEQAQAAATAAEAALKLAETQLSWTTIASPLDGLPSVAAVSPGDLVTSGQSDALATVTQLDPIDVDMYEPSARLQRIRDRIESGQIEMSQTLKAQLTLENGATYAATGEMVAPGYTVSTSTGAIDFRFRFDNPERRILPGMFVRGTIEIGRIQAILVPQMAATRSRDGTLSAWVAEDGKAAKRVLTEEGVHQNSWIVTAGLQAGDALIVNGITGLAEGAEIAATPVEIDENGVVRDLPATQAE
ncbi:efflux RND transporter periplasmic adaptor subunit [Paracoccus sp. PS-1]|uniref:efflux RND transporter periplasmic adaptor subunit n=1 Tax=unclassified Paracoccus (in: a-proteobacteria) TaxID=2688777 RepID=UPI00048FD7FF|nr:MULTISPECIES: efflux RND transporter periplasmic adaptor subunit [unclassified Paracoccus (in: a-proteobacteria)]MDQ7261862.1 efflux RND transporter periplasmic adaptor subunit [Paracoccus sp. PS1]RQP04876.1 MAG: efflux RND transporter periplasmic adaptor subunit [Paracoccus sp. BP8]